MRLNKGELPPMTGILTKCKICNFEKDDALFKWQNGKRQGLVCRSCDLQKKREAYSNDEELKKKVAEKAEQWRLNNIEHYRDLLNKRRTKPEVKAKRSDYHNKNSEKINAKTRKWYEENKDRHRENGKKYRKENEERLKEIAHNAYVENKENYKQAHRNWRKNNPHMVTFYTRQYNLSKEKRTPSWANLEKIKEFYKNCPEGYQVDHIYPLHGKTVSGLHIETNLQYLTKSENCRKSNKCPQL